MDAKWVLSLIFLAALLLNNEVEADFFFNPPHHLDEDLTSVGLKCVPGRTVIRIQEPKVEVQKGSDSDSDGDYRRYGPTRKKHMNWPIKNELCRVCVCSAEGKDEYCSDRPAMNVNECILISKAMERFNKNQPFELERNLAYRIRRDYIWHNDEIPYEAKARCARGHSYYSNSAKANDTDIDVASDVETLLDYSDKDVCFYCVCSVHGRDVGCITRKPWYCEYYRSLRSADAARNAYTYLFQEDRPTYFRQLSYRLRRTMDDGIQDLMRTGMPFMMEVLVGLAWFLLGLSRTYYGGDALCCGHSNGHRRQIHNSVRTKLRILKKKLPKENLLGGGPKGDYDDFIVNND